MTMSQEKLHIDIDGFENDGKHMMITSSDKRLEVDFRIRVSKDKIDLLAKSFVSRESVQVETVDGLTFGVNHYMGDDERPAVSVSMGKESCMYFFLRGKDVRELQTSLYHLFRE